jgi:transglutaminase-like putative cysteine protease
MAQRPGIAGRVLLGCLNRMRVPRLFLTLLLFTPLSLAEADNRSVIRQDRGHLFGYRHAFAQSSTIELELSYEFSAPGQTHRISFIVPVPQTMPNRQKILSVHYDPKPSRIIERNGNRYAEFVFVEPEQRIKTEMRVTAELFRYDLLTARRNRKHVVPQEDGLADFLHDERFIEKDDDRIQEIAGGFDGRTEEDVVLKIYNYVLDHMEYGNPSRHSWGAVTALQRGKGDCTEYADLFVALCRAKDIPARVVSGYTVRFDSKSPKHNWVEAYLDGYGWIPFDPTAGDIENAVFRGRAFSQMRPVYLYLSHVRNDEILGDNTFGAYVYWGDRPRFKESAEFKFASPAIQRGN